MKCKCNDSDNYGAIFFSALFIRLAFVCFPVVILLLPLDPYVFTRVGLFRHDFFFVCGTCRRVHYDCIALSSNDDVCSEGLSPRHCPGDLKIR